jgi:hypothetical protein
MKSNLVVIVRSFFSILLANCLSLQVCAQVASYPFNGNANDIIAGNNAIVVGATLANDRNGVANSAYFFDGIDDYLEVLNPSTFNFGLSEFAVSVWIQPTNENGGRQMIFQKGNSGGLIPQYWMRLNDSNSIDLRTLLGDGNPPSAIIDVSSMSNIYDGNWHNIIFQRTAERNELYIDCQLVGTNNDVNRDVSSSGTLFIGAQHPLPGTSNILNYYSGFIDDLAFFDSSFDMLGVENFCVVSDTNPIIAPIPTLSQWSLIILTLLTLISGTIAVRKLNFEAT